MHRSDSWGSILDWLTEHPDCEIKMSYALSHVMLKMKNGVTCKCAAVWDVSKYPDLYTMLDDLYGKTVWSESDMWRAMS